VLPGIQHAAGQERQIRVALSADPHDRAGARRVGGIGCTAQGSHRLGHLLQFRRRRDGQAETEGRRELDGEGGFSVWGKQTPAATSLKEGYLPLGLAHQVKLKSDIAEGQRLKWSDVAYDADDLAVKVRREMETAFRTAQV
jgi:hypothetical protein